MFKALAQRLFGGAVDERELDVAAKLETSLSPAPTDDLWGRAWAAGPGINNEDAAVDAEGEGAESFPIVEDDGGEWPAQDRDEEKPARDLDFDYRDRDGDFGDDDLESSVGYIWDLRDADQTPLNVGSITSPDGSERRAFVMHENLLRDVIQRQAGSLSKAVLEGVMNIVEAGATRGSIVISGNRIVISDDGRGFESREEILQAFEVFGKSDKRRAMAGRWAEFQMGRGQLMAFGKTTYRTRTFEMTTDIAAADQVGIGYTLRQDLENVPGCTVTVDLYHDIHPYEMAEVVEQVGRVVRYVDVPIEVNGKIVTVDPSSEKWSFEDENAYYRVRSPADSLDVYNIGVFVCSLHRWATGGIIVSKKRLKLNFARNDVISSCPVWNAVIGEFKSRTRDALLEKKAPTVKDVRLILEELKRGYFQLERVAYVNLLRDTNDRRLSPYDLVWKVLGTSTDPRYGYEAFSFDHAKSLNADYAMQSRKWLLLDLEFCSEAFEVMSSPVRFDELGSLSSLLLDVVALRRGRVSVDDRCEIEEAFVVRDDLYAQLDFAHYVIGDEKLDRDESAVMAALRRENRNIASVCREEPRLLLVGAADGAEAWTDGSRIVIERSFLRRCLRVPHGLVKMLNVLVHEYTHNDENLTHDPDFDRRFHDAIMRIAPMHTRILSALANVGHSRLVTFRKPAAQVVEIARRLSRDAANRRSEVILPCPGCAAIGPRRRRDPEGVSLSILSEAVSSDEAFERIFGHGFAKPKIWSKYGLIQCPICDQALHESAAFKATSREQIQRVCELAVTSVSAAGLTRKGAQQMAKATAADGA